MTRFPQSRLSPIEIVGDGWIFCFLLGLLLEKHDLTWFHISQLFPGFLFDRGGITTLQGVDAMLQFLLFPRHPVDVSLELPGFSALALPDLHSICAPYHLVAEEGCKRRQTHRRQDATHAIDPAFGYADPNAHIASQSRRAPN